MYRSVLDFCRGRMLRCCPATSTSPKSRSGWSFVKHPAQPQLFCWVNLLKQIISKLSKNCKKNHWKVWLFKEVILTFLASQHFYYWQCKKCLKSSDDCCNSNAIGCRTNPALTGILVCLLWASSETVSNDSSSKRLMLHKAGCMTEELKLKHYLCDAFFLMKALHPFIPAFIPAKYLLLQAVVALFYW